MAITVLKHNVPWGPFTRDQIREGIDRGDFTVHYLAHATGLKTWLPLGEVLDYVDRGATLPPLPSTPAPPATPSPATAIAATGGLIGERLAASRPPALPIRSDAAADPATAVPAPPLPTPQKLLRPAPIILRFMALVIDCGILFVPIIFLFLFKLLDVNFHNFWDETDTQSSHESMALLQRNFYQAISLVTLVWSWLYAAGLEASHWQGTIGKQWMGMKVSDGEGERVSFLRASSRHFCKFLSGALLGIGFFMALFGSRRLALHDRLSGTRVIR